MPISKISRFTNKAVQLAKKSVSYKTSRTKQQVAGSVSNSSAILQDIASVDNFLNAAATETVPLFEHLEFEFLLEHEFISLQISFAAFCID